MSAYMTKPLPPGPAAVTGQAGTLLANFMALRSRAFIRLPACGQAGLHSVERARLQGLPFCIELLAYR